mgnify:CR=1 FL=1
MNWPRCYSVLDAIQKEFAFGISTFSDLYLWYEEIISWLRCSRVLDVIQKEFALELAALVASTSGMKRISTDPDAFQYCMLFRKSFL